MEFMFFTHATISGMPDGPSKTILGLTRVVDGRVVEVVKAMLVDDSTTDVASWLAMNLITIVPANGVGHTLVHTQQDDDVASMAMRAIYGSRTMRGCSRQLLDEEKNISQDAAWYAALAVISAATTLR